MLVGSAALVLVAVPGIAAAGSTTGGEDDNDAQMLADALRVVRTNFATYNDRKWDELALTYAEDAVFLIQNQDPVRGRDAITEAHRRLRDVTGPVDLDSVEVVRASANATTANGAGGQGDRRTGRHHHRTILDRSFPD